MHLQRDASDRARIYRRRIVTHITHCSRADSGRPRVRAHKFRTITYADVLQIVVIIY